MSMTVETATLPALLAALRLPTVARLWPEFCARADKEGWPAERLLAALCELELSEREQRRIQRHLAAARLPQGKTLDVFDFLAVPTVSQARVRALAEGDGWLQAGHNLLAFGPPGAGKTHLAAGIGYELIQRGYRVLMARTSDLVQRLQMARQELALSQEIAKLDKFDLLILDDLSYVRKDQAETSALFELIAARYERRSIMITANQPFSGWDAIFPDKAMTIAAIDRLVHHATIFEMNVESYRRRAAYAAATSLSDIAGDEQKPQPKKEKDPAPSSTSTATSDSDIAP